MVFGLAAMIFVGFLSCYHCTLIAKNRTTYEDIKIKYDNWDNPYSRGIIKNCLEVWCSPVPPSRVNFRQMVPQTGS